MERVATNGKLLKCHLIDTVLAGLTSPYHSPLVSISAGTATSSLHPVEAMKIDMRNLFFFRVSQCVGHCVQKRVW